MSAANSQEVVVLADAQQLAAAAADRIIESASAAIAARRRFTLVLSGGSTPEKTYALLTQPDRIAKIDWSKVCLFFGDERVVPTEDSRSNFHMAKDALLDRVPVPADRLFAIATDKGSPSECAAAYARRLATFFNLAPEGPPPTFDLILLGLGDDGHTASLFPGATALKEAQAWVTWSPPGTLPPPVDRVTLTYPVLNAARHVMFLVAGANKAAPLRDVLEGRATSEIRPAVGVRPKDGKVTWLIDEAATSKLPKEKRLGAMPTAPRGHGGHREA